MQWNTILTFIEEHLITIAGNAAIVIAIMKGKYISPAQAQAKKEKALAKIERKKAKMVTKYQGLLDNQKEINEEK